MSEYLPVGERARKTKKTELNQDEESDWNDGNLWPGFLCFTDGTPSKLPARPGSTTAVPPTHPPPQTGNCKLSMILTRTQCMCVCPFKDHFLLLLLLVSEFIGIVFCYTYGFFLTPPPILPPSLSSNFFPFAFFSLEFTCVVYLSPLSRSQSSCLGANYLLVDSHTYSLNIEPECVSSFLLCQPITGKF